MSKCKKYHTYGIIGVIVLVLGLWNSISLVKAAPYEDEFEVPIQAVEKYDMAFELLDCINQKRESMGLQTLVMDRKLMDAALIRAAEVNVLNSHWRPNGTRSTSTMDVEAEYENINSYAASAKSVYEGWLTSTEGHQIPITDPACRSIGIGIVNHAAVAEFSYAEPDEVKAEGINNRIRSIQFRLSLCRFSLNTGDSLEYRSQDKLMLVSTIENRGIPTEIDRTQIQVLSSNPDIITVLSNGVLYGTGAGTAEITVAWKKDTSLVSHLTIAVKPLDISIQGNAEFVYEKNHIYSGKRIEPKVTVIDCYGNVLQEGGDYALSYTENGSNEEALIEVRGMGNYSGIRYLPYYIQKTSVSVEKDETKTENQQEATETTFLANFNYIIPNVVLSQTSYIYDGTAKRPTVNVIVKDEKLQEGIDYRVSYENNTNPGQAEVVIQGIGRCSGKYRCMFFIEKPAQKIETEPTRIPVQTTPNLSATVSNKTDRPTTDTSVNAGNKVKVETSATSSKSEQEKTVETVKQEMVKKVTVKQPKIRKVKRSKKRQITVYWKKDKSVSGYQIQIADNKKMSKGKKTISVSKKKTSYTVKKLKSRKTYYVRIRSYKKVKGKIYYSHWSKIKAIKVK